MCWNETNGTRTRSRNHAVSYVSGRLTLRGLGWAGRAGWLQKRWTGTTLLLASWWRSLAGRWREKESHRRLKLKQLGRILILVVVEEVKEVKYYKVLYSSHNNIILIIAPSYHLTHIAISIASTDMLACMVFGLSLRS